MELLRSSWDCMLQNTNVMHCMKQVLLYTTVRGKWPEYHTYQVYCKGWDFWKQTQSKENLSGALWPIQGSLQNFIILKWTSNIWNILGPAYGLTICEVRNTSLVLLWKAPVYEGKSPITGYLVDYKEVDTEDWITANEKPTSKRYFKVTLSLVSIN